MRSLSPSLGLVGLTPVFCLHCLTCCLLPATPPCPPSPPERVLFAPRTFDDIEIRDISLEDYIAVKGKYATYLPHTAGRYQKKRFRKATVSQKCRC